MSKTANGKNSTFNDDQGEAEKYWSDKLSGDITMSGFPSEHGSLIVYPYEKAAVDFELNEHISDKIKQIANKSEYGIFMILLSGINYLLHKYTGHEDIVIGVPALKEKSTVQGADNITAIRTQVKSERIYKEMLGTLKQTIVEAYRFSGVPFDVHVRRLKLTGFKTIVLTEGIHHRPNSEALQADTVFCFKTAGSNIKCSIEYNKGIYERETIGRIADHFARFFDAVILKPDIRLSQIDILTEDEKKQILFDFNSTKAEYPRHKTIQHLFEEQAAKHPDHIAVVYKEKKITYKELNAKANGLAWILREKGVKPDAAVAIMTERSVEMIIGILGILKAGGAYLPLSPQHPQSRIEYMIKDSGAEIVVTAGHLMRADSVSEADANIQIIDLSSQELQACTAPNLPNISSPSDLAYVIYTSGTTGNPKGVMIEHHSVINLVQGLSKDIYDRYKQHLNIALLAPYIFDASVQQIFASLLLGHTLYIPSEEVRMDAEKLVRFYNENAIDVSDGTPAHISVLLDVRDLAHKALAVKHFIIGGEALNYEVVKKFLSLSGDNKPYITNVYGPTECCVDATSYLIEPDKLQEIKTIPIGTPMSNVKVYILGKDSDVLPIGAVGEMYISGAGVARGYLGQEELTGQRFIPNPFAPGEKMYKTGDLARYRPNGLIEYIGRIDHQVKIRGYRIEIGEIESNLLKHPHIKEAVVTVKEDDQDSKYLCAYIAPKKQGGTDDVLKAEEIKTYLLKELPEYMVPTYIVPLEKLPINTNGKIDRKALPDPIPYIDAQRPYEEPRSETEQELLKIWQELLQIDKISVCDSFFDLGGHSLKAARLAARIHKELDVEISLSEIFERSTIRQLSDRIESSVKSLRTEIQIAEEKGYYPLSSSQKGIFAAYQLNKDSLAYNLSYRIMVEGEIDKEKLENAFKELIKRHESLRTSFEIIEQEPVQKVHKSFDFKMAYKECGEETADEALQNFLRPFVLEKAPLIGAALIKQSPNKHILWMDIHHIIADGMSISIILKEISALYEGSPLPPLRWQYKDYTLWQNQEFEKGLMQKQESYWLSVLSGELPVLNLPTDYQRPSVQSDAGDNMAFELDKDLTQAINKIAKSTGTTLYMVLFAAYNILLSKYSGQEDIIIGSPAAGRTHTDFEGIVGMFVNTLAVRNFPRPEKSFKEFLKEVKENALGAYQNQDYPIEMLMDQLSITRGAGRSPLFDTVFVFQNTEASILNINHTPLRPSRISSPTSKFDITLEAIEKEATIALNIEYCTKLFKRETIESYGVHFINILKEAVENTEIRLKDIDMLQAEEKHKILYDFNDTKSAYPSSKTVHELFEEQTKKTPDHKAVVFNNEHLTYRELNKRANGLAHILRRKGVKSGSIVGLMTERSLDMVVGMISILKAGGAYLPIDPDYPPERSAYMLQDSKAVLLLTQRALWQQKDTIESVMPDDAVIVLDAADTYIEDSPAACENLSDVSTPEDLAYIMYTSGSTGKPKGVMVEQKNIVRLVKNTNYIEFKEDDRILQTGAIVFDACTFEIWGALLNGLTLHLVHKDILLNAESLEKSLKAHQITILWLTSALFTQLAQENIEKPDMELFSTLRYLLVGGDVLSPKHINAIRRMYKDLKVVNGYGPTENTTFSTCFQIDQYYENIPIGKPISNSTAYILDKDKKLQPIGVPGELYVGGDGVARGYLNAPELTAERFIGDPFANQDAPGNKKMYKTGDLARWLPDGNIEFFGRIDQQVKIRGFRIELGEIENALLKHPAIKEAVVTTKEDESGMKYLCAYMTTDGKSEAAEIRAYLSKDLPHYMIPAYFIRLDKIPLTQNGKVDTRALPKPEGRFAGGIEYEAPGDEIEAKLAELWSNVLNIEKIGIHDNFFELGGHSLKGTKLISAIHKAFNKELHLSTLFKHPTIKGIGDYIKNSKEESSETIKPVHKMPYYPASSAQKRMFILSQFDTEGINYNVYYAFTICGKLNKNRLWQSFDCLIKRHESLRTSFELADEGIIQIIHEAAECKIDYFDSGANKAEAIISAFMRPFDLSQAPLMRIGLIKLEADRHILLLDMHHIITDGTSMGILLKELLQLYDNKVLAELSIQYKDYAIWHNNLLRTDKIEKQGAYWLDIFKGKIPVLDLPLDYPRSGGKTAEGKHIGFTLNGDTLDRINKLALDTKSTSYMILLAAYYILLAKYTTQEDIIIGSPISGRHYPGIENLAGMFVNTIAMRNYPKPDKTILQFIGEVRSHVLGAYENQDYQFEDLIDKLNIPRSLERNPLFDTMFSFNNNDSEELSGCDLTLLPYKHNKTLSKFDLLMEVNVKGATADFVLEYNSGLFTEKTVKAMMDSYKKIIKAMTEGEDKTIGALRL